MNLEIIGLTFDVLGKVLIAYTAIKVHYRVRHEHQIDDVVFKEMRQEQWMGITGIAMIVIAYFLEVIFLL